MNDRGCVEFFTLSMRERAGVRGKARHKFPLLWRRQLRGGDNRFLQHTVVMINAVLVKNFRKYKDA